MKITIKFANFFKTVAGVEQEQLDIAQGSTVDQLSKILSKIYRNLPFENDKTFFMVNDKIVTRDQVLSEDDQVRIFQTIAGG